MDLIVDANILFAALIKKGITEDLFFKEQFRFFAPEYIFEEFDKYKELILSKTDRTDIDFEKFIKILKKKIKLIPNE
ncbi:hypothetical protein HOK51_08535 [Candidatus Woesearchaeota archaeon]|jgi:predicted nucleic acid-binding protein|nr:hypothetical protein [Candidatus Woesearchaeota archaeon]MBT6519873.1 hypothetical protein [Candidatus Woesearchaeota archaeon]MBT7367165.1 hypothetical protein [Candidatus Woesearchaeota archaeon]